MSIESASSIQKVDSHDSIVACQRMLQTFSTASTHSRKLPAPRTRSPLPVIGRFKEDLRDRAEFIGVGDREHRMNALAVGVEHDGEQRTRADPADQTRGAIELDVFDDGIR